MDLFAYWSLKKEEEEMEESILSILKFEARWT